MWEWCCVITASLYVNFVDQGHPYIFLISTKSFLYYLHMYSTLFTQYLSLSLSPLQERGLNADDFVHWGREDGMGQSLVNIMLQLLFEVCHVKLGLHPTSAADEASVVR